MELSISTWDVIAENILFIILHKKNYENQHIFFTIKTPYPCQPITEAVSRLMLTSRDSVISPKK